LFSESIDRFPSLTSNVETRLKMHRKFEIKEKFKNSKKFEKLKCVRIVYFDI